jgi:hypothetical protein
MIFFNSNRAAGIAESCAATGVAARPGFGAFRYDRLVSMELHA